MADYTKTVSATAAAAPAITKKARRALGVHVPGDGYGVANDYCWPSSDGGASYPLEVGQTFTAVGGKLSTVAFSLQRVGNPAGSMTARLYAHTGTWGSGAPDGLVPLAESEPVLASSLTTGYTWVRFSFPDPYQLTAGTHYVVVLRRDVAYDTSNHVRFAMWQGTLNHPGNNVRLLAPFDSWTVRTDREGLFRVYENVGGVVGATVTRQKIGGVIHKSLAASANVTFNLRGA